MEKRNSPAKSQKAKNRLKNLAIAVPLAVALTFSSCDSNPTTVPELKAKWENVKWKNLSAKQLKSLQLQSQELANANFDDIEQRDECFDIMKEIRTHLREQEKQELQEKFKKKNLTPEQADQLFLTALDNNDLETFDALLNIWCINNTTAEEAFLRCIAVANFVPEYWNQYDLIKKYPFVLTLLQNTSIHISDKIKEEALLLYAREWEQYRGYTLPVIKELLKSWVNINCRDGYGNTPLILAAQNVRRSHSGAMYNDVFEFFLSRKDVDLYAKDKRGLTALDQVYDPELKEIVSRYYK